MLNKSLSYKILLRIAGFVLIACGLYFALRIAFVFVEAGDNASGVILDILGPVGGFFPSGGALLSVGLGLFFLGLSSMSVKIAYWSLQLAIWLIGVNLWYQQNGETDVRLMPPLATPLTFWPQMGITAICSLLLLALYIPLTHLLRWFFKARDEEINVLATSKQ